MKSLGFDIRSDATLEDVCVAFTLLMKSYLRENGDEPFSLEKERLPHTGDLRVMMTPLSPEIQAMAKEHGLPRHI